MAALSSPAAIASWVTHGPGPSPVNLAVLVQCLEWYPDQRLASFILVGFRWGFLIGISGMTSMLPSSRNHPSCSVNPGVVSPYVSAERAAGRLLGPLPASTSIHVSPIRLVPKGHQGNSWRLTVDLSHPSGRSVNDFIDPDLCSPSYPSVDDAVGLVLALGRGTQLGKIDLKSAYRILPIHPEDRQFLGISWEGRAYIDRCLPFGLRLAPKIFTAFADGLAWVLRAKGLQRLLHYLQKTFYTRYIQ